MVVESGGVFVCVGLFIQFGFRVKCFVVDDDGFIFVWIVYFVFVGEEFGCCLYCSGNWFIIVNLVFNVVSIIFFKSLCFYRNIKCVKD